MEEIERLGYVGDVLLYSNVKYDKFIKEYCKGSNSVLLQTIRRHKNKYKVAKNQKIPHIEELNNAIQNLINEYNKTANVEQIPLKDFSFTFTEEEILLIYDIGNL